MNIGIVLLLIFLVLFIVVSQKEKFLYNANYAHYYPNLNVDIAQHPLKAYKGAYTTLTDSSTSGAYPDLVIPSYNTMSGIKR